MFKEEILGCRCSMHGDILALIGEPLSFVFSTDGSLISAPAVPVCEPGRRRRRIRRRRRRRL